MKFLKIFINKRYNHNKIQTYCLLGYLFFLNGKNELIKNMNKLVLLDIATGDVISSSVSK